VGALYKSKNAGKPTINMTAKMTSDAYENFLREDQVAMIVQVYQKRRKHDRKRTEYLFWRAPRRAFGASAAWETEDSPEKECIQSFF
jgi:hypothetical protein